MPKNAKRKKKSELYPLSVSIEPKEKVVKPHKEKEPKREVKGEFLPLAIPQDLFG